MRRSEREVKDKAALETIIKNCQVLRIAVNDAAGLYLVPVNFGYRFDHELVFYFHSAKSGRKVTAFAENPAVAFELDCNHALVTGATACHYSYRYCSIIGNGKIALVEDADERCLAMTLLMRQQSGEHFAFTAQDLECVHIYRLRAESFSGKANSF